MEITEKIRSHQAVVAVMGLGYVGLPLAVGLGEVGFRVIGIDPDVAKVERINQGISTVRDITDQRVGELVNSGRLEATTDFSVLGEGGHSCPAGADIVLVCVPTPLNKTGDPDVSFIVNARDHIRQWLHRSQLIILESTTYPGTLDELILPPLEETGLKVGIDFFLAFSPERIDPNNQKYRAENIPKVIGGVTENCTEICALFYTQLMDDVVPVSSPMTAEMVKLLENTFRAINIGLVNELAVMCRILGVDVWEVIDAAATKPFGFMPFHPGPGLGGHCIPVDPSYLSWKLRTLKYHSRFIDLAAEINASMPKYVVGLASECLNEDAKPLKGSKILSLGVAYKRDVDDLRESPAFDVIRLLLNRGADVTYHDPYIPRLRLGEKDIESVELTPEIISEQDLVIILTDHSIIDYETVCRHSSIVLDTRNATKNIANPIARVVKL